MAENIIAFIIVLFVSAIIFIIGVFQTKSIDPVGFYTFEEAPKKEAVTDIKKWNKKHGYMLMVYSAATVISFLICLFFDYHIIVFSAFFCVVLGLIPLMMLYHCYLKKKYYR